MVFAFFKVSGTVFSAYIVEDYMYVYFNIKKWKKIKKKCLWIVVSCQVVKKNRKFVWSVEIKKRKSTG